MNHDELRYFDALAEELHFGAAAQRLNVSTSTLSRRVSDLERLLGVRLFQRSSRRVALSPAGTALLAPARRILAELEVFDGIAQAVAAGRLGAVRGLYSPGNGQAMVSLVRRLRAERPDVEVVLEQRVSQAVAAAVSGGEADIGICRALGLPGLGSVTVSRDALSVLVMPIDHPLVERNPLTLADIDGATVIGPNPSMGHPLSKVENWRQLGICVHIRYEQVSDEADLLDRVAAGYGVCLVTPSFAERNHRDDIVARPCLSPVMWHEDHLIWRLDNDGPILSALVRIARAVAAEGVFGDVQGSVRLRASNGEAMALAATRLDQVVSSTPESRR